ncbi:barrier-to-autointegration factor B-like [Styela clava]|uniref:barrier-to-autointegration factor B-like n=1 Tax=Styela clava TaxID=7725 RepID=UPI001939F19C|nr:barrier-to-autointegration factor B-like [Styela clava]
MSSTSQKHRNFVGEPMGDKCVTDVAGIGKVYGQKLCDKGFDKAYVLLGQFLLLKKDEEMFRDWLLTEIKMRDRDAINCASCLKEWSDAFL